MPKNDSAYYIGLDCGTSSVGWAVTDDHYNLLRAKGETLWGFRLFDEAETAAKRRIARSSRRRIRRNNDRVKLLNILFEDEMAKVDPEFYLRLKKAALIEEDKYLKQNSKNTLFNDPDFKDKDFHKKYPTIWHLRKAIVEAPMDEHFDLRLYYLAIHHILTHRGHFLRSDKKIEGAGNFQEIFDEFCEVCDRFGIEIEDSCVDNFEKIISDRKLGKRDKAKELKSLIFKELEEPDKRCGELTKLLTGSKVTPLAIFETELSKDELKESLSFSFADNNIEEKLTEAESLFDSDQFNLVEVAKKIYDYGYLSELLNGESLLSNAMVKNYEIHQAELCELKRLLKPFKEDYDLLFKTFKVTNRKTVCYDAYIGKAYTEDKSGRRKTFRVDQEAINKEIERLLKEHNLQDIKVSECTTKARNGKTLAGLLERQGEVTLGELARDRRLLPKQKGQARGTIPQQLHHNELEKILEHLVNDYPSFGVESMEKTDGDKYNTKAKKIARIHDFRIPYYCGPIKKHDEEDRPWSWGDEEIAELVRPWNFKTLVNLDARANEFIKRMKNSCTYLVGETTLPKASPLYQKYTVLNELNNLKINGVRIDQETKKKIYERVFLGKEKKGNITLKKLEEWMRENGVLESGDELSGSAESKFLPKLSTHRDFQNIFGPDYAKKFSNKQIEEAVELITILNNEPGKLCEKLQQCLGEGCSAEQAKKLARKGYKDWAKFSRKFLTEIKIEEDGRRVSIIEMLEEGTENLMELLSSKHKFKSEIDKFNEQKNPPKTEITYEDVKDLYCSPAVKRTIWQAIKIIDEIVKVKGFVPAKIFLESTREEFDPKNKGEILSRHKQLIEKYKSVKCDSAKELLEELKSKEPRELQSKKLFLYFSQMGCCAYCGKPIHPEELGTSTYDIDHIYPRSKTKDDSITRNLVLVHATENRGKTNVYPISNDVRSKMRKTWSCWRQANFITQEKYDRLVRSTELTPEELSKFIARQIVETAQSVKALRDLLSRKYPNTKIVLVKAKQVSDFRHHFANGYEDKEIGKKFPPRPEFIKLRGLNDIHHAKDAYLNIVVGNVMSETFTDNPYRWLEKDPENVRKYSINPHSIWREKVPEKGGVVKGWNYADSVEIISKNLSKNNVLWTRMTHVSAGNITDLQPVGKGEKYDQILPLKRGLDPKKYGGYNSVKGAYFTLIEQINKKGAVSRKLIQIPVIAIENPEEYIMQKYGNVQIIIPKIPINSLLSVDGILFCLKGRTGNSLICSPAMQLYLDKEYFSYFKKVYQVNEKILDLEKQKKEYLIDSKDGVDEEENSRLYEQLVQRLTIFETFPELGRRVKQLRDAKQTFEELSINKQCKLLVNIVAAFDCNSTKKNLSDIILNATGVGTGRINNEISRHKSVFLIYQSPTGLFERKINLKTCLPQNLGTNLVGEE